MEIVGALPLVKHLHRHKHDDRRDAGVHEVVEPAAAPERQPEPRVRTRRFERDPQRDWGGVHKRPTV